MAEYDLTGLSDEEFEAFVADYNARGDAVTRECHRIAEGERIVGLSDDEVADAPQER